MAEPIATSRTTLPERKLALPPLTDNDFRLPVAGARSGRARVRVIKGVRFTEWGEIEVEVREGFAVIPPGHSIIFVQHRHGRHNATPQHALLADWGELRGAIATTYSHDSHNLVVLGRDAADMKLAANALIECGGGMAVTQAGRLLARVEMPIAGLLSAAPPAEVAAAFGRVRDCAGQVVEWKPPYRVFKAIEGTSLACNPGPHLTDLGLTDGTTHALVDGVVTSD
jgi:adenine deaminase